MTDKKSDRYEHMTIKKEYYADKTRFTHPFEKNTCHRRSDVLQKNNYYTAKRKILRSHNRQAFVITSMTFCDERYLINKETNLRI